jgi:pimeloyl-ACP methyl ester carboxylesterase
MRSARALILVGLIATLLGTGCRSGPPEEDAAAAGDSTVASIDGVPIHYRTEGQGDYTLLFVHGWCTDMSYWDAQIPSFRIYYQVVTLDLAGHGRSGSDRRAWTMEAFGQDVAAVVNALDLQNVILVGHSMGGPVILEAAKLLPERVIGLVGVDTFSDIYLAPFSPQQIKVSLEPFRQNFQEGVRRYVLENYFRFSSSESLKRRVILEMADAPEEIGIACLEQLLLYDAAPTIQQLSIPMRSINADRPLVYFRQIRDNTEAFTNKFLSGVGHFLMIEQPEAFNRTLADFLGQIIQSTYERD